MLNRHQNSEQNDNISTANRSIENVANFKYLETTQTSQYDYKEINSVLNF
jgi:hypothetical protein